MAGLRRVRLTIAYDGAAYAGWQRQINALAVQQVLEDALGELLGETILLTGASRTDSGVHALGQVAHFDTSTPIPDEKICFAINTRLPYDIRVVDSRATGPDFHARFHAEGKRYRYLIHNHRHGAALERGMRWHVPMSLNLDAMGQEAAALVGRHDFAAFAASGSCVKDTVRTIKTVEVRRDDACIAIYVEGNGFLYNMVRIVAGTLVDVGCGRCESGAIARALASHDRLTLGQTAPAHGLTLMKIWYPGDGWA